MTQKNSRRDFIKKTAILSAGLIATNTFGISNTNAFTPKEKQFKLPRLAYDYNALEPHIDALTMEIHHSKHHQGYVNKLNKALEVLPVDLANKLNLDKCDLNSILSHIKHLPTSIRNNAGGHYNHSLYWELMNPKGGGLPTGDLNKRIIAEFGSFEAFKNEFSTAAKTQFGSGWTWLIETEGKLVITSTANQDNPLMVVPEVEKNGTPILALDVWEHAYYLKNQNNRSDYINAWFNLIDWDVANKKLA